jgi:hypothetical protein
MLTFIVPVRHPANARDWNQSMRLLTQTLCSIARQQHPAWRAVVVANHEADLPVLPAGVEVERVDFPANPLHQRGSADIETFYDAFRLDKGRRVLAGMLRDPRGGHYMIVDDDDMVSDRLAGYVAERPDEYGWVLRRGYLWEEGRRYVYLHPRFSRVCGTSHIVRADLYRLPERLAAADEDYVRRMLGSHKAIEGELAKAGTPLAPLPFPAAVYRIGHPGAHSQSGGLFRTTFFTDSGRKSLAGLMRAVCRLRPLSARLADEFFPAPMQRLE